MKLDPRNLSSMLGLFVSVWLALAALPPRRMSAAQEQRSQPKHLARLDLRVINDAGELLPNVRAWIHLEGAPHYAVPSTGNIYTTDDLGLARMEIAPDEKVWIKVEHPTTKERLDDLVLDPIKPGETRSFTFHLSEQNNALLEGQVVDQETGEPIQGALIVARTEVGEEERLNPERPPEPLLPARAALLAKENEPDTTWAQLSDTSGLFEVPIASWRDTTVLVQAAGYATRAVVVDVAADVRVLEETIRLRRGGGPFGVRIRDMPAGAELRVAFQYGGLFPSDWDHRRPRAIQRLLLRNEWRYVTGVRAHASAPASGARAPSAPAPGAPAYEFFALHGIPAGTPLRLSVVLAGDSKVERNPIENLVATAPLVPGALPLEIDLGAIGRLDVQLTSQDGGLVAGQTVMCERVNDPNEPASFRQTQPWSLTTTADSQGCARFRNLIPGVYRVALAPPEGERTSGEPSIVAAVEAAEIRRDAPSQNVELRVTRGLAIRGRIDPHGIARKARYVRFWLERVEDGARERFVVILRDGVGFEIQALLPGSYRIEPMKAREGEESHRFLSLTVEAGDQDVQIPCYRLIDLSVTLTSTVDGRETEDVKGVRVRVIPQSPKGRPILRELTDSPTANFGKLSPDTYRVEVTLPSGEAVGGTDLVINGTEPDQSIELSLPIPR